MSFLKFAWLISWLTLITMIPQDLVKGASSIGDLFHQQQKDQENSFCQLTSALNSSSLNNLAPVSNLSFSSVNSSSNLVENSLGNYNFHWLSVLQNLFNFPTYSSTSISTSIPKIQLVVSAVNPRLNYHRDPKNLTEEIQPIAYISNNQGNPQFNPPQKVTSLPDYQIWLNNRQIINIEDQNVAKVIAQRLEYFLAQPDFDPQQIYPTLINNKAGARWGDQILFLIDDKVAHDDVINKHLLALQWVNNLRGALNAKPLDLVESQLKMYNLEETNQQFEGTASWYGPYFHGRLTANGEVYNQYGWTAAHPSLKLGTYLKITNLNNQKTMILRINDRGPYIPPRTIDLSLGSAWCLNTVEDGVIPYKAVIMATTTTDN